MRLTASQRLVYDAEKYIGGSISVMCGIMTVQRFCPVAHVVSAIREIYRTNDVLNLRLDESGDEPLLYMTDPETQEIPIVRVDDPAALEELGRKTATTPLDLRGSLCVLSAIEFPGGYGMLLHVHHLLGDAWSMSLICNQLNEILEGKTSTRFSYTEFADAEAAYFNSKRGARDRAYFLNSFDAHSDVVCFSDKDADDYGAAIQRLTIPAETRAALASFAERVEITESALWLGLFALFFAKYKGPCSAVCQSGTCTPSVCSSTRFRY